MSSPHQLARQAQLYKMKATASVQPEIVPDSSKDSVVDRFVRHWRLPRYQSTHRRYYMNPMFQHPALSHSYRQTTQLQARHLSQQLLMHDGREMVLSQK
jgi:hypothetical protein